MVAEEGGQLLHDRKVTPVGDIYRGDGSGKYIDRTSRCDTDAIGFKFLQNIRQILPKIRFEIGGDLATFLDRVLLIKLG